VDGPPERLQGAFRVSRGGAVVAEEAAGVSDPSTGEMCTARTRFAAASIGKNIVAAAGDAPV